MKRWLVLALLWGFFFSWYTSFRGPLQADEIERYMTVLSQNARSPEGLARWRHFMETDTGDDFAMANFIELREEPEQVEGVTPGESSTEVLSRYTKPFLGAAARSAAHPVLFGWAAAGALDHWGIDRAENWTNAGVIRYRSRRDVLEQAVRAVGQDIHRFKIAAMEKTIAFPIDPWFSTGDPRFLLALVLLVIGLALELRSARARAPAAS
jgi:hypothetical protein